MAKIEKTVFISYRRTDAYTALAVYENLKNQGYDVFFDYRSITSGDFEQIIIANIKARAHFLLILTPTALDRCNEPGDWLRREIEFAIDEKRNLVPLFFKGFRFGTPVVEEKLSGKLENLSRYNGLNVHEDYFDEAMHRLSKQYLSKPLDTVLHPVSTEVQKVVEEEQNAADEALKHKEEKSELEKLKSQAIQYEMMGDFWNAQQAYYKIKKFDPSFPRIDVKIRELERELQPKPEHAVVPQSTYVPRKGSPWKPVVVVVGALVLITLFIWGSIILWNNLLFNTPESTQTLEPLIEPTLSHTDTPIPVTSTPVLKIGSTSLREQDGMLMAFVPDGSFTMGSNRGDDDELPVHQLSLSAFWIDRTEITNSMYAKCAEAGECQPPIKNNALTRSSYFNNPEFANYPAIYIDWNMANDYCEWVGGRLPTEAEWEKAARGSDTRTYPWGEDIDCDLLNYNNCVGDTSAVGSYEAGKSIFGVYDMAGNVIEWTSSLHEPYPFNSMDGRENPSNPDSRILRGGTFYHPANDVRLTNRFRYDPANLHYSFGFRCAMDATP